MAGFRDVEVSPRDVRALKRGDERVQQRVYLAVAPAVERMAAHMLSDTGAAQEVVQDTMIDAFTKVGELANERAFVGWVRRIAANSCIDRLRAPWHSRQVKVHDDAWFAEQEDPLQVGERAADWVDLELALAALPEDSRAVLWLHDVEGYTHREIGDLLGRTASFSKSKLARAYARLIGRLESGITAEANVHDPAA